ncbi:unnamed protein product [Meloidogyne enterolobii]|uniref:Uncharacterized protein n=1 Tax=Meloidogyne enterolobii TaxID=390850 RepID=A0ACB1AWA5_MELEN
MLRITALLLIALLCLEMVNSCGFPMPAPAPTMCCCGGGGGGGCGRRKRAVQPHFKGSEIPCPQIEWKRIVEKAIIENVGKEMTTNAIQSAMNIRFPDHKFIVTCASLHNSNVIDGKSIAIKGVKIEEMVTFISAGDGYCNLMDKGKWCQVVALSA